MNIMQLSARRRNRWEESRCAHFLPQSKLLAKRKEKQKLPWRRFSWGEQPSAARPRGEAEGRGRGSVCVSAQRGGSRRRTLVPLRRAPPPPSPQEPCLALEPVGAERGPGCLGGPEFGGREAVSDEPPRRPTGHVDVPRTALVRARSPQGWRRKEPVSRRSLRGSGQEGRQAPGEGQGTSPFRFHLREQKTVSRGTGRICARAPRGVGWLTPRSGRRGQEALHPPPPRLAPTFYSRSWWLGPSW